ncbi:hypothetical protein FHX52_3090 [Humibacillus xanthopallidus]|uniref:Uncharacterized protein n=1 Tax=Humibacillus xanthopallidus TaxID=412689 RepID=A0A543PQN9_9MICO|nr:hypothetical protein [Humibacillus xanthopallidus]TQN46369.1 hypothetical protein FHX52_3090 [Humibacillus xanthopallidus]
MAPVPDDDAATAPVGATGLPRARAGSVGSVPPSAAVVRWLGVGVTLVAAVALLLAATWGYAALLGVTLVLALLVAWGWPPVAESRTPDATSVVLALSAVAIVLSALREDLEWLAAGVAFGILLSFCSQLIRPPQREGLVLTLLASFGGLVVIASGTSAVVAASSSTGAAVAAIGGAGVAAALVADLVAGVVARSVHDERAAGGVLAAVALVAAVAGAVLVGTRFDEVGVGAAALVGAVAGLVSWALRRVLVLQPAMSTLRGQVGASVASVLVVGAVLHTAATLLS